MKEKARNFCVKNFKQLAIYLVVGAGATLVEWGVFFFFNAILEIHYAVATTLAFACSTIANWAFGRLLLFHDGNGKGLLGEISSIYAVSIAGLLLNLAIMWCAIEIFNVPDMAAKILATSIVFLGNFAVRKFFIYKI